MIIKDLYKVKYKEFNNIVIELADESHLIFKAHFPQNPILPAFIHFEIVSEIFNIEIQQIKKAKFTDIVRPNETLCYKRDGNKYSVILNEKQVASFSL